MFSNLIMRTYITTGKNVVAVYHALCRVSQIAEHGKGNFAVCPDVKTHGKETNTVALPNTHGKDNVHGTHRKIH